MFPWSMYCCIACLGCTDGSRMCACWPALCCWRWIVWCMHVSCVDSDVHSCFELWSALSQASWIRRYIRITYYYYYYALYDSSKVSVSVILRLFGPIQILVLWFSKWTFYGCCWNDVFWASHGDSLHWSFHALTPVLIVDFELTLSRQQCQTGELCCPIQFWQQCLHWLCLLLTVLVVVFVFAVGCVGGGGCVCCWLCWWWLCLLLTVLVVVVSAVDWVGGGGVCCWLWWWWWCLLLTVLVVVVFAVDCVMVVVVFAVDCWDNLLGLIVWKILNVWFVLRWPFGVDGAKDFECVIFPETTFWGW